MINSPGFTEGWLSEKTAINNNLPASSSLIVSAPAVSMIVWPSCSGVPRSQPASGVSSSTPRWWRAASSSSPSSGSSVNSTFSLKPMSPRSEFRGNNTNYDQFTSQRDSFTPRCWIIWQSSEVWLKLNWDDWQSFSSNSISELCQY